MQVTTQEIIDYLALQGITAERKVFIQILDLLIDFGMDIIKKPGRSRVGIHLPAVSLNSQN